MKYEVKTTRVNLDGTHFVDVSVNEKTKTVVAELISDEEAIFIYAEKFDAPCNYLRTAIKKSLVYLNADTPGTDCTYENRKENTVYA